MQDELANAISTARSLVKVSPKPLDLGSVVKHSSGNMGIVFGIKAPYNSDDPWSYCVITKEGDDLIEAWMDAEAIEEIPQAPSMPQPQPGSQPPCIQWVQIGGEISTENYDSIDSCESWVEAEEVE